MYIVDRKRQKSANFNIWGKTIEKSILIFADIPQGNLYIDN